MNTPSRRLPAVPRIAAACLSLLALVLALVAAPMAPAHADTDSPVRITSVTLTAIDDSGSPIDRPLYVNDSVARMEYAWDARADLKEGDSFSIGLPSELSYRVTGTESLTADLGDGSPVEVATCEIAAQAMTCTFNGVLPAKIAQGYKDVSGTGRIQVTPLRATTATHLDLTVNGEPMQVDLPAGSGIGPDPRRYEDIALVKEAGGMTEDSTGVTWYIGVGTAGLTEAYQRAGDPVTFDGVTPRTIVLTDTLGEGQSFPEPTAWRLTRINSSEVPRSADHWLELDSTAQAGPTTTEAGAFSIDVSYADNVATITLTGPFAPRTNYNVVFAAEATNGQAGKALPGFTYANEVSLPAANLDRQASTSFAQSFDSEVTLGLGGGGLAVTKRVEADAAAQIPADAAYTVEVDYTLPNGLTVDDYPGWTPPGTVKADRTGGTLTVEVTADLRTVIVGQTPESILPVGTVVALKEAALDGIKPAPGFSWGSAVFTVDGAEATTLTIGDGTVNEVVLTNTVTGAPQDPAAPESPAPSEAPAQPEPTASPSSPASARPSASGAAAAEPAPALARTGATIIVPIIAAVAALIGGVLLVRRRKA